MKQWIIDYRKGQDERGKIFSRVRAHSKNVVHAVLKTKYKNRKSDVFSICKFCSALKINGICINKECKSVEICMYCGGIILPNRKSYQGKYELNSRTSHGICGSCFIHEKGLMVLGFKNG